MLKSPLFLQGFKLPWVGQAEAFVVTCGIRIKFATKRSLRHLLKLQTDQKHPHYKTEPWFQRSPPIHVLIPFQGTTCFESHFVVSLCSLWLFFHRSFCSFWHALLAAPSLLGDAMHSIALKTSGIIFCVSKERHVCIQMYHSGHTMHISMTTPFLLCMQRQPSGISPICQRLRRVGKGVDFPSWSSSDFHCQEVIFVASIRSPINTPGNTSQVTTSQVVHSLIAAMWHDLSKFQRDFGSHQNILMDQKMFNVKTITWRKLFLSTLYTV